MDWDARALPRPRQPIDVDDYQTYVGGDTHYETDGQPDAHVEELEDYRAGLDGADQPVLINIEPLKSQIH